MDNKVFGMTFIAIISSALLLFGVANAGAAAVDKWLLPTEKFGEHTYIGTTDVSNMEVASAMAQFQGTTETWRESTELLVTYQDATAKYPLDNAEILLEETAAQAQTGVQNSFIYQLQDETTAAFLAEQFPVTEFSAVDVENVTVKLEQALQSGLAQTQVTISDDSLGVDRETVTEVVFPRQSKGEGAAAVVQAIDEVQIAPGAKFSFLDYISELKIAEVTDAELTEIASAIYTAVLQTNFTIDERSIGAVVPESTPIGQEAAINRSLGVDLVFTNPNASSFTLNTAIEGNSLAVSLSGFPLVYDYAVQTSGKETVKPRLTKQYSALVSSRNIVEEGSEGIRIQVLRSVMSEGEELAIEPISTDFYPPTHRVEVYPLASAPVESTPVSPDSGTNSTTIVSPDGTTEVQIDENGEVIVTPENKDSENTESTNSAPESDDTSIEENSADAEDAPEKAEGNTSSNSDDDSEPSEPVYDKGGNLVKP